MVGHLSGIYQCRTFSNILLNASLLDLSWKYEKCRPEDFRGGAFSVRPILLLFYDSCSCHLKFSRISKVCLVGCVFVNSGPRDCSALSKFWPKIWVNSTTKDKSVIFWSFLCLCLSLRFLFTFTRKLPFNVEVFPLEICYY